jgi:voltage-gated potassium channel
MLRVVPAILALLVSRLKRSQAIRLVAAGVICLLGGAAGFAATQHVSFGTAVYWAITTATTVGYGDVVPKNAVGRAIASLVMLTTIPLFASAFAFFAGAVAATHLRRLLAVVRPEPTGDEVVIYGADPVVPQVASALAAAGRRVIVVSDAELADLPDQVRVLRRDPTSEEAVRRSHPERASEVLVTGRSDADVLVTAVLLRQAAQGVPMVALAHSASVCRALRELGVPVQVSADELVVQTLTKSLEAPHAGEVLLRLVESNGYRMQEVGVAEAEVGQPLSQVRARRRGLVLGLVRAEEVRIGVTEDPVVEAEDRLVVVEPAGGSTS